ncbi:MAG: cytochrome-c peroxidase [Thioalkalivibrio sp.]|nr:cytochrome-c peroxidase [Thioalkalivibrio sp.]
MNKLTSIAVAAVLPLLSGGISAAPGGAGDAHHQRSHGAMGPHQFAPVTDADFYDNGRPPAAKVELGRMLMFDKILSGNRNISCAACHHSLAATGDGLSLPIGEGGRGLGITRDTGPGADAVHERVPRNAPPVFNLGAREMEVLFHDGRVQVDASQPSGFRTPAGATLPAGLDNALAAQAMFPVTSMTEMAGQPGENSIADAAAVGNLAGLGGVWEQLALRLQAIPGYVDMFIAAFDDIDAGNDITYVHAANAIAAFESVAWRADNSPFDRFLRGDRGAMSSNAIQGMRLFYTGAGNGTSCGSCHSGRFQTDNRFHAIAMPQIGAGKGHGYDGHSDFGRAAVSGVITDHYRFRTPTLRNVAVTAPYGHSGAFNDLRAVVEHHLDPVYSISHYDSSQVVMPSRPDLDAVDFVIMDDPARVAEIASANELAPMGYSATEVDRIMDFLHALTDPASLDLRNDVPKSVPSGLPLAE